MNDVPSNLPLNHCSEENSSESLEALIGQVADEFTERLKNDEQPEIEEYAQRYPQIASVLRQVLPTLQVMGGEAADPLGADDAADSASPLRRCLGDFCILREIGRGGMGIVYEAEQLSLGRRVALKVLPFAATLDGKQLQRFKHEAQAAGQLHHPNIVPVYAVGCERGVHYYAMQLIDGQTLSAMIRGLRQHAGMTHDVAIPTNPAEQTPAAPATGTHVSNQAGVATERSTKAPAFFRTAATLGVQAATALQHAHAQGVVHRDIKPSNLLVDARGDVWIADFGLARLGSDAGLTMTGDVMGTLRYMSPEQALAKRTLIDQRTDIYSLGATLYELLTLEPAFPGRDRQEVLRQIAFEEPRPPRQLNSALPMELETIVLKAMAKNREERYETAQELADDR